MQNMHKSSTNPNLKTEFALRFLKAYSNINKYYSLSSKSSFYSSSSSSSSASTIITRSRRIQLAANASMACAAGDKMAWSRALLHKLRRRGRLHYPLRKPKMSTTRKIKKMKCSNHGPRGAIKATSHFDQLRQLVPGGKGMDYCRLLKETANYIKCLEIQAHVMQDIAESLAN